MHKFLQLATLAFGIAAVALGSPAKAELVNAKDPATIKTIIESQGMPAELIEESGKTPYIESSRNGLKYLILFMNCDDSQNNCKTLQFYMGFSDAKQTTLEELNAWNSEKRFARAYRDKERDPVLEMDLDLDFAGLPRENVGEAFNTWAALMDSFHALIFKK